MSPGDSTLTVAMRAAAPGDSLVLQPGTYVQWVNLRVKAGLVITSLAGPGATIVEHYPYTDPQDIFVIDHVSPPPTIEGLTIAHGSDLSGYGGAGILIKGSDAVVRNNLLVANATGDFEGAGGHGAAIAVYGGHPLIEHNTIVANWCDLGAVDLDQSLATVEYNVMCYTTGSDTTNTGMGLSCYFSPGAVIRENLFWGNGYANLDPVCSQVSPADSNLILDPKFCRVVRITGIPDPLTGDWRVAQNSPLAPGGVAEGWGARLGTCPTTAAVPMTWGKLKSVYRR